MRKKHILTAALYLCLIPACNTLENPTPIDEPSEIVFGVEPKIGIETVITKAVTETVASTLDDGFKVAAIVNSDNSTMFNSAVSKSGSIWKVSGTNYYFPSSGTMNFFAVWPSTQTIAVNSGAATLVFDASAGNIDLVGAKSTGISKTSSAVNLTFNHLLSEALFTCKGGDSTVSYELESLSIAAPKGGTYSFADGSWAPQANQTYPIYSSTNKSISTSTATSVGEAYTFLPGTDSVSVKWICKNKTSGLTVGTYNKKVAVTLTKGMKSTINLTLPNDDMEEIKFTITVTDWATESQNITVEDK